MSQPTQDSILTGTAAASYAVVTGPMGGATPTETEGECLLVNTHATLSLTVRQTVDGTPQAVITLAVGEQYRWPANNRRWNAANYVEVEEGTAACTYRIECSEVP